MLMSTLCAPAPWPVFDDEMIAAVSDVLKSGGVNYWTTDVCQRFETAFAQQQNSMYAVALANGTLALEVALEALEIGVGDEVIVPCRSFYATASAVARCGATPVFADINLMSQNIDVQTITPLITEKTKAIIVVHLAGWPADMEAILALAKQHKLKIIEDCAQAQGAQLAGQAVGTFGDCGVFSFCQDKIMTTGGEGGMLITDDNLIYERAWSIKDHGKSHTKVNQMTQAPSFQWLHDTIGSNYRMSAMQAAIGLVALERVVEWVRARRKNANYLFELLKNLPGVHIFSPDDPNVYHAYYKVYIFLEAAIDRGTLIQMLNQQGIVARVGACPYIHKEHAFQTIPMRTQGEYLNAQQWAEQGIMLLIHPGLSEAYFARTADCIASYVKQFSLV